MRTRFHPCRAYQGCVLNFLLLKSLFIAYPKTFRYFASKRTMVVSNGSMKMVKMPFLDHVQLVKKRLLPQLKPQHASQLNSKEVKSNLEWKSTAKLIQVRLFKFTEIVIPKMAKQITHQIKKKMIYSKFRAFNFFDLIF